MSIKSLLDNILNKNADGVTADFTAIMNEKVAEAIDAKRIEVAQSMFNNQEIDEEVEEVEELDEASYEASISSKNDGHYKAKTSSIPSRRIKGKGYGNQFDTDEDGEAIEKAAPPVEKRGRGRPRKDAGSTGASFSTDGIAALLKSKMAALPKGKSRKISGE